MSTTEPERAALIHDRAPALTLAREALELVGRDPAAAVAAASDAVSAAKAQADPTAEAVALRARSLGCQELGQVAAAVTAGRAAVKAAVRAGTNDVEAETRMSLAFVLLESGNVSAALHQADLAASSAGPTTRARVGTQRALVLQRIGRHAEALDAYASVLPALRRAGDTAWEARLRNNRGLLHAYHGSLRDAEADLQRAMTLYDDIGARHMVAGALSNLGFVAARRGDAATALARFDEADAMHRRLRRPMPQLRLDRAEVLVAVGLFGEARRAAEKAVAELTSDALGLHLPEAHLLLAQAAIADGDAAAGRREAQTAARLFAAQGRDAWAVLARHVRARAAERSGDHSTALLAESLAVADLLAAHRWASYEMDMRITAATVALARGQRDLAREQLGLVREGGRPGSLSLGLRSAYADALLRLDEGDRTGAERALRAGSALLDRARAGFGATELRMHVSQHGRDITELGLRLAVSGGTARKVLAWAERSRAATLRLRPVRPPQDEEFASSLADLRRASAELEEARLGGQDHSTQEHRVAVLESRVRRHARRAGGSWSSAARQLPSVAQLAGALDQQALVELIEVSGRLHAVTLTSGRARLHDLGPADLVTASANALRNAVRRLAAAPDAVGDRARQSVAARAQELHDLVVRPLSRALGDRSVVLVPTATLQSAPWAALPGLHGAWIAVAPSAATWLAAAEVPAPDPERVLAVAGPRLDEAPAEAAAVAAVRRGRLLAGSEATVREVMGAMGGATTVHIAAHGNLRADNPLLSSLELADGPLTVYDLERLVSVPRTVVLPACQSGASAVRAGDEVMGLAHVMLSLGSATVVAAVVPVPDAETGEVMRSLHERLAAGDRPAAALAAVQAEAWQASPRSAGASLAFACFGAG